MTVETNFSLQKYNSFNVNAIAKYFVTIDNEVNLHNIISNKMLCNSKYFILGNGTNVLFTDEFYNGVVLKNNIRTRLDIKLKSSEIEIVASSGIDFDLLIQEQIKFQQKQEITAFGLENLALIPGNIGAAVVQNIGAFGVEQKDFFVKCSAINLNTGDKHEFTKKDCKFDYRFSHFKTTLFDYFITEATYSIPINSQPILTYSGLRKQLADNPMARTPANIYDAIRDIREQKIPTIETLPNAGSFFKNPIVTAAQLENILVITPSISYFVDDDIIKVAAASLIEHCGLKGIRHGNVGISDKHALILVNFGTATGDEIARFANYVISEVKKKYEVEIVPEVVWIA